MTPPELSVHMNGRIYDPLLGRFLSADPNIDGVLSLQGYNRYSYVHNNPLTFTDPTGFTTTELLEGVVAGWLQANWIFGEQYNPARNVGTDSTDGLKGRAIGSRCTSHERDKLQSERRRETSWISVELKPSPSPTRSFPGLEGHEYRFDGAQWCRCEGKEEFADFLESESKRRGFYRKRTRRNGVAVEMRRSVKAPLEILTTTFAPWLSDWTSRELCLGRNPRPSLAAIRNGWLKDASYSLRGQRHVLGYALHADTDDLHFDLVVSRQDGFGGRIGQRGLRLCGPWLTAVDRHSPRPRAARARLPSDHANLHPRQHPQTEGSAQLDAPECQTHASTR